jgi:hypothetical protein
LPSVAEAFGLALVESLFLGTPVLATHVGGIPEIVRDGEDGLLVPASNPGALAALLQRVIEDPRILSRLRGAGSARMKETFCFETMMRSYEALYEELIAARS